MAYWEFLLQKEGDRDWLPLETAHVEISEGRYRIIAHTSYCETPVDIRLSQLLADHMPPRWKTFRRLGHTTENGLMAVIPFTHLAPGRWRLKCAAAGSDPDARWEYGVQLQVLAIESSLDYWDTDLEAEALSPPPAELALTADTHSPAEAVPPPAMAASVSPSSPPEPAPPASPPPVLDSLPLEDLPLRLQLQHQAIVAQQQAPVMLQGQVTTFSQVEGLPSEGTLWVQLRDPETGEVVHRDAQTLRIGTLPSRFDFPLTLPEIPTPRLLVGEMSLWTAATPPQVLAIQGFTVTLNLDALLERVANRGEQATDSLFEDLVAPLPEGEPGEPEAVQEEAPASVLAPIAPREIPFQLIYLPSTGFTLPPVIYRPIDSKLVGTPSLPPLPNQLTRRDTTAESPSQRPARPLSLPPIGRPSQPQTAAPTPSDREPYPTPELPALERSPQFPLTSPEAETTSPEAEESTPGTAPEFRPDFQSRFWSRLSALAHESQQAAANLKAQMAAAGVETSPNEQSESPLLPDLHPPELPTDSGTSSHEVVIYDSPLETEAPPAAYEPDAAVSAQPEGSDDLTALGDVPVPQLNLPKGDLVAGTPLPITVCLPLYPRRLAVKLWVTDVQSRSLADRPRWLMTWTPTGDGEQTALLQLQVPLGSVEVQFDAIAIDLATQRESYKTSLTRTIVPANVSETGSDLI